MLFIQFPISAPNPHQKLKKFKKFKLCLFFDDVVTDDQSISVMRSEVEKIINSFSIIKNYENFILCHCFAGYSRSPAMAFILKAIDKGPGQEYNSLRFLSTSYSDISPNKLMIHYAHEILGGALDLVGAYELWEHEKKFGFSQTERKDIEAKMIKENPNIPIL